MTRLKLLRLRFMYAFFAYVIYPIPALLCRIGLESLANRASRRVYGIAGYLISFYVKEYQEFKNEQISRN